jgi:hypothetical protein
MNGAAGASKEDDLGGALGTIEVAEDDNTSGGLREEETPDMVERVEATDC